MKPLSEQLGKLADRAKKTEDTASEAREHNREKLEMQRTDLKNAIAERNAKAEERWNDTRSSMDQWFASKRAAVEERRTERDIKKAQHNADVAEQDAADAIDIALYVLDQAEFAVIDAVIARTDADELASTS
jgi:DNA helicase IV